MMSTTLTNQQFRLASRPAGMPTAANWHFTSSALPALAEGEILVKTIYLSLDPAMRGWMNDTPSYIRPVAIDEVMRAIGIGRVIASRAPAFEIGDIVAGGIGVQQYWSGPANDKSAGFHKIDARVAPLPKFLSVLGMPGMTAYFGLMEVGKPKPADMVVVSGAAGAVGMAVGQIARHQGCRAIGIAGGPQKCNFVVHELGFDACIDYKKDSVRDALKHICPNGVDIYFDNVGGEILDTVLPRLALHARVVLCGAISQYNNTTPVQGPSNYLSLLVKRARMEGMVVFDYAERYPEAVKEMARWMKNGTLKSREDIVEGIENFPQALQMLFEGKNFGKLILQLAPEEA